MSRPPRAAPAYPAAIEAWWLARASRIVGPDGPEPARWRVLENALARLCEGFTADRAAGLADYAERPEALAAYGLYYFPQGYVRVRQLLDEAAASAPAPAAAGPRRVLDLGAGTGAAACAAAARDAETRPGAAVEIVAVDRAPASLGLLRELFADLAPALWPHARLEIRPGDAAAPAAADGGPWDLILASMSVNELFEGRPDGDLFAWAAALRSRLKPGGLLAICEPGTPAVARRLQRLRDAVAADGGATIRAPCPHHAPCPLLRAGEGWCHDVRRWDPPPAARRINRRLHLPLDVLRYSLLALENTPRSVPTAAANPGVARLVAPPFATAGRIVFRGCAATGALETYEVLTRGLDRAQRAAWEGRERGDRVAWPTERQLGDRRWRLRADGAPGGT